jgi:hypothetical protein
MAESRAIAIFRGDWIKMNIKEKIEGIESDEKIPEIYILYALLELAMKVSGRGDISEDYTKTIEFRIGEINIILGEYYGRLIIEYDYCEYEIMENDPIINNLKEEVKKRILEFDKKTRKIKEKISEEVFDKSLSNKILKNWKIS